MKTRNHPTNSNCPLSSDEEKNLNTYLDKIEWEAYFPLKQLTSAYSRAKVIEYDEFEIMIELEYGVDGDGRHYTEDISISRSNLNQLV